MVDKVTDAVKTKAQQQSKGWNTNNAASVKKLVENAGGGGT